MKLLDPNEPELMDFDEREAWEARMKREKPIAWFIRKTIPQFFRRSWRVCVHEPWYWLKCRLWHQYNVIRIKTLPPTWIDRDEVLLHAAFQILTDFVEGEEPWEAKATPEEVEAIYGEFGDCSERKKHAAELQSLYRWWKVERPARKEPTPPETDDMHAPEWRAWGDAAIAQDRIWDAEDDANLKRLIDIRQTLWT